MLRGMQLLSPEDNETVECRLIKTEMKNREHWEKKLFTFIPRQSRSQHAITK